jgi:hypothetical protein
MAGMKCLRLPLPGFAALLCTTFFFGASCVPGGYRIVKVEADGKGFSWPYYAAVPNRVSAPCLIVETNNPGQATDGRSVEENSAENTVRRNAKAYRSLGAIVLSPAFPTQGLALGGERNAYHLDEQLLAMIEDAQARFGLEPKDAAALMVGFSASGRFANRFAFLHPERVLAVAAGGCGSIMLPLAELGGRPLPYPLGLADFKEITGREFDRETFLRIPQLYYVGGQDKNDPLSNPDAHRDLDRDIVYSLLGGEGELADRLSNVSQIYYASKARALFIIYPGLGHATSSTSERRVFDFVKAAIEEAKAPPPAD